MLFELYHYEGGIICCFHILRSHEQSSQNNNCVLVVRECSNTYYPDLYLPPEMKLWQSNAFTPVCDSVHGGWYLSGRTPGQRPSRQRPSWTETPRQRPPGNQRAVCILLYWYTLLYFIILID